jgi:hypothetical protein
METEILKFTNIDSEDYLGMYNGKNILVKKGESKALPSKVAKLLAWHLAYKILLRSGKGSKEPLSPEVQQELADTMVDPLVLDQIDTPIQDKEVKTAKSSEKDEEEFEDIKKAAPKRKKAAPRKTKK